MRPLALASLAVATFAFAALCPGTAAAHLRLDAPTARFSYSANGIKTGPCATGTRTNMVTTFRPGETVVVKWTETVGHAGHYRIALSANESDFVAPTSLTVPMTKPAWVLVDGIADKAGTNVAYEQSITLPAQECPSCVLQVIQVMGTGTDGSTTNKGNFDGNYFVCADLRIVEGGGAGGAGGGGAGGRSGAGGGGATGTGGRTGMGGRGGSAGSGTGGAGTGGATGSGGTPAGSGGTVGGSGGATSSGTGGTTASGSGGAVPPAGTGGATTPSGSGGATASRDAGGSADDEDEPGGCAVIRGGRGDAGYGLIALVMLVFLRPRRSRR